MSHPRTSLIGFLLFAGTVGGARAAHADIPPPNTCLQAGTTCHSAGTAHDETGTCRVAKCQHATADGSVEYDCVLCQKDAATGGASGSAGTTGAAGAAGTSGGQGGASSGLGGATTVNDHPSGGGCTLSGSGGSGPGARGAAGGIFSVLIALVATRARRRRR